ncbi:hypothetical protein TH66_22405 [Carbonactinospora thermoautotrophica]|uniref:SUKH-4 immunity protein n=1 Tax=Carbonactinospora thermoautotrophica TaxID=1469144 RepID=A0A132MYU3_9ACTN|nr:SUKH-4 family immunity protein [Carbonactinospora thermoautotrophica]KWW98057.1 hypothetical protein TH66_22405 [Carbonactinospora thermoautotrophica]KWX02994.1 hypothetical protein LI90_4043 [Carbonactinospora thermoautotrophica]KWX08555.1 hypothetical protein TR74_14475 [Carbonactinospora thermoautotrophica]
MLIKYSDLADLWEEDELVHFPFDRLGPWVRFGRDLFPPGGAMPVDVPILFTVHLSGDVHLFSVLRIQVGEGEPGQVIVLGAVPGDQGLLYCLDTETGAVLLLGTDTGSLELVNSSFALFVEFLYRLAQLIRNDPGGAERAAMARHLRTELAAADPAAFEDPESWWSVAFMQLESTR